MIAIDYSNVSLDRLITHHIGSRHEEDGIAISTETTHVNTASLDYILQYFLSPFEPIDFHHFTHSVGLEMNEVYTLVSQMFDDFNTFQKVSESLASLVYESSDHPKVKPGELSIAYFNNIQFDDEIVDAIGIFKSENNVPFVKLNNQKSRYAINHDFGFELKGIDKGCLVFNTSKNLGYSVLVIDNARKFGDAKYWVEDFLQLKPSSDAYHNTKDVLKITKDFVTKQISGEEFGLTKTDKIEMLNQTMDYFKNNDSYNKEEFETQVFKNEEVRSSYQQYNQAVAKEKDIELEDNFDISAPAVQKQSRAFKSVLKLDKNFHVYIHGDKSKIERGIEEDGRKFYKIYYEKED